MTICAIAMAIPSSCEMNVPPPPMSSGWMNSCIIVMTTSRIGESTGLRIPSRIGMITPIRIFSRLITISSGSGIFSSAGVAGPFAPH
ncbi:hypothetical protein FNF31_02961 [Cafeteria roenbergensis]|uniref:Uncharacterized protein n=1 Tax=Cafeteria roenbergensis TaxID=33653 RepID=A0A5A8DD53_CAFRO|nr:hypothetical protein FNF31_02961 [Cafeteria roenbergensis]KAA0164519.1 hypothetical protein FNF28_03860 [Cafeteria roenbergensis]